MNYIILHFSYNNLQTLDEQAFYGLGNSLTHLRLNHNQIREMRVPLQDLYELEELTLDNNPVSVLEPHSLPQSLHVFSLTCCYNITAIPQGLFYGLRNLTAVYISDNVKLVTIDPDAFDPSGKAINTVDFSNNNLSTLSENALDWQNIDNLKLSGNPWHCDCDLQWVMPSIPDVAQTMM